MAQGQEVVEGCASQIWRVMAAWVGGGDHNRCMCARKIEMSIKFDEKMCLPLENRWLGDENHLRRR